MVREEQRAVWEHQGWGGATSGQGGVTGGCGGMVGYRGGTADEMNIVRGDRTSCQGGHALWLHPERLV